MGERLTQIRTFDSETGELLSEKITSGSPNGKGFVMVYTDRTLDLISKCPSATTLKVFMLLAMNQQYEERGYPTTKKAVQEKLHITKQTCLTAFKWLKENFIINEYKVDGVTEYMVNPAYVTVGRDKKKRVKEWHRRWENGTVLYLQDPVKKSKSSKSSKKSRALPEGRSVQVS